MKASAVRTALVTLLKEKYPTYDPSKLPDSAKVQRGILGDMLISSNEAWSEQVMSTVDKVWEEEHNHRHVVHWTDIPDRAIFHGGTEIAVWKGDITNLDVDAVVNAANDQGLGCFVPAHRCIDNTIHRAAGPRLRDACRVAMEQRNYALAAGTAPLVTPAFHLPSSHVIHVTGPHIVKGRPVTDTHRNQLAKAYQGVLDACIENDISSVALCGISTGLFGFPREQAARIALKTVVDWLNQHPGKLESVTFDVFSDEEEAMYRANIHDLVQKAGLTTTGPIATVNVDHRTQTLTVAKKWIEEADSVLICAGAGMSVKDGEMVYVNRNDFAKYYPWFLKWGYKTAYETMGLFQDSRVPLTAKWGFWATHMHLMRWGFEPNKGYSTLLNMVKDKDYFVLTSNVDGCFERSGFETDRIYTPQGEWTYYQCQTPCRKDAVFESRPMLDKLLPHMSEDGRIPRDMVPKCKYCGGSVFGNVRADGSFIHTHYDSQNDALRTWMDQHVASNKTVAVVEIGAGFNTPTVTRFPVEAFARDLGHRGRLIRINPSDPEVPSDLTKALSFAEGWQVLDEINDSVPGDQGTEDAALAHESLVGRKSGWNRSWNFGWDGFLKQLKR